MAGGGVMFWLVGGIGAFFAGAVLSFTITNSIRVKQIENIRKELRLEKQEKERLQALLKQCDTDLSSVYSAYTSLTRELKQQEITYSKRLKEYAEQARKINIAQRYDLRAEGEETCGKMKNLLDKLVEVEK
jgi:septal ring factor EnvC (AmiA/AmiB activator)